MAMVDDIIAEARKQRTRNLAIAREDALQRIAVFVAVLTFKIIHSRSIIFIPFEKAYAIFY